MHPYILNINEDTQLSGVVKLFIQEGESLLCPRLQLYDRMNIHALNQDFGNCVCVCFIGEWDIGLSDSSPRSISIRGLG